MNTKTIKKNREVANVDMEKKIIKVRSVITNKIAYQKMKGNHVPYFLYECFFNIQAALDVLKLSGDHYKFGTGTFCYKHNLLDSDVDDLINQNCNANYRIVKALYDK